MTSRVWRVLQKKLLLLSEQRIAPKRSATYDKRRGSTYIKPTSTWLIHEREETTYGVLIVKPNTDWAPRAAAATTVIYFMMVLLSKNTRVCMLLAARGDCQAMSEGNRRLQKEWKGSEERAGRRGRTRPKAKGTKASRFSTPSGACSTPFFKFKSNFGAPTCGRSCPFGWILLSTLSFLVGRMHHR